ncbi:hypothetical protein [Nocardia sp. BMG111209]|uniref:hypothetical protein n=1 Tax=Nocardia sp. BMG111209 TaxID=1160137 RepID=UPI00037DACC1|nr:hypothetical protein [Nocardia sp. BMG111209]
MSIENERPSIGNGGENPKALSHWDIYRAFHPLDTTDAHTAGESYRKIATGWSDAVRDFGARILRSSASAWDGPAAQASRDAIGNYVARAHDLTPALNALADRVGAAVESINDTKTKLPEPISTVSAWNYQGWTVGPLSGSHAKSKIDHARDEAQRVMGTNYVTPFGRVDGEIPVLPTPVSPAAPLFTMPEPGSGPVGHGAGPVAPPGADVVRPDAPQGSEVVDRPQDSTAGTEGAGASGPSAPSTGTEAAADHLAGAGSDLPSTRPAGIDPPVLPGDSVSGTGGPRSGTWTGGGPGTAGPGFAGPGVAGPEFAGPGAAGPGGGGPVVAGPGRSVAGAGGVPAAGPRGAVARGGSAAGLPGMGMPGGKARSEEDERTRLLPEWLRTEDNAAELLGREPRTLLDGVLGAEPDEPPVSEEPSSE